MHNKIKRFLVSPLLQIYRSLRGYRTKESHDDKSGWSRLDGDESKESLDRYIKFRAMSDEERQKLEAEQLRTARKEGQQIPHKERCTLTMTREEELASMEARILSGEIEQMRRIRDRGVFCGTEWDTEYQTIMAVGGTDYTVVGDGDDLVYHNAFVIQNTGTSYIVSQLNDVPVDLHYTQLSDAVDEVLAHHGQPTRSR